MTPQEYLYRYEQTMCFSAGVTIACWEYIIVKETPCGYWINHSMFCSAKRWTSKTGKKRFAYPTKADALDNFICRRTRQIEILTEKINTANSALHIAITERNNNNET